MAICKSQNGESGNRIRAMMGENQGGNDRNTGNQGENAENQG